MKSKNEVMKCQTFSIAFVMQAGITKASVSRVHHAKSECTHRTKCKRSGVSKQAQTYPLIDGVEQADPAFLYEGSGHFNVAEAERVVQRCSALLRRRKQVDAQRWSGRRFAWRSVDIRSKSGVARARTRQCAQSEPGIAGRKSVTMQH